MKTFATTVTTATHSAVTVNRWAAATTLNRRKSSGAKAAGNPQSPPRRKEETKIKSRELYKGYHNLRAAMSAPNVSPERRVATALEAARREQNMGGKEGSPIHVGQQCPTDRNGGRQVFQRSTNEGER